MGESDRIGVLQAFHDVIHAFGVKDMALLLEMPIGTLYNKCNLNNNENNHNKPLLTEGVLVTKLSGNKLIAQEFCRAVDMVAVSLPDLSDISTDALLIHLADVQIRNGSFHHEIHDAMSGDNQIDRKEYARIERQAHLYVAAILESLARMKEMSCG